MHSMITRERAEYLANNRREDIPIGVATYANASGRHWAIGVDVTKLQVPERLMWTACGRYDIPANMAVLKEDQDDINCAPCLELENAGKTGLEREDG